MTFMNIQEDKIREKAEELEKYPGYLPAIIMEKINILKYYDHLEEMGLLGDVGEKIHEFKIESRKFKTDSPRDNHLEYKLMEFKKWISENPQYSDFYKE